MKKALLLLVTAVLFSGSLFAAEMIELDKADLEYEVENGNLTIALSAETKGWVAVGLGSSRMDGSSLFIGYNRRGEEYFREDLGKGHFHSEADVQHYIDYEVSESDGFTTVRFTVKLSDFVKSGENKLPVIVAYGARDNFTSMHRYRDSLVLEF